MSSFSNDAVFKRYCREGVIEKMTRASYWAKVLIGDPFVGPEDAEEFAALAQEELDRKHGAESRRAGQSKRVVPRPTPEPADPDDDDDNDGDDDDPDAMKSGACASCRMQNRPGASSCKWCLSPLRSEDAAATGAGAMSATDHILVLERR